MPAPTNMRRDTINSAAGKRRLPLPASGTSNVGRSSVGAGFTPTLAPLGEICSTGGRVGARGTVLLVETLRSFAEVGGLSGTVFLARVRWRESVSCPFDKESANASIET